VSAPPVALGVRALGVTFAGATHPVLDGIDLSLRRGEALGIIGASGAGKTTLALALVGLLPRGARYAPGTERHLGATRLDALDAHDWSTVRGRRIAMVFQEPLLALHPAMRVGGQIAEAGRLHGLTASECTRRMREGLELMGFAEPDRIAARFPHQLSGGQRQRALLAMAMLMRPEVLIADEPTTALDPERRDAVCDVLTRLRRDHGTALLFISHDTALLRAQCETVVALRDGRLVNAPSSDAAAADAPTARATGARVIAADAAAPRTRPSPSDAPSPNAASTAAPGTASAPLLRVEHLRVGYGTSDAGGEDADDVLDDLSFTLARGEVLGVVGPSGAGKTTLAHAILCLIPPRHGRVVFDGTDLATLDGETLRTLRRRLQHVAQDAGASLPPHQTASAAVAEGLLVHGIARGAEARASAVALLAEVGFPAARADARIDTLSSGERQRIAIARALGPGPELLICDEPTASLDPDRRAQVLTLLERLRDTRGLALLLISHDHAAIARLAPRVLPL
jgi:peptide/nickel transport system ATP-binding protein